MASVRDGLPVSVTSSSSPAVRADALMAGEIRPRHEAGHGPPRPREAAERPP